MNLIVSLVIKLFSDQQIDCEFVCYIVARSLASVAYRRAHDKRTQYHFDYFTVDFNEVSSCLSDNQINMSFKTKKINITLVPTLKLLLPFFGTHTIKVIFLSCITQVIIKIKGLPTYLPYFSKNVNSNTYTCISSLNLSTCY